MLVLLIDDEEMILNLGSKILHRDGHETLVAKSGSLGIDIFKKEKVDLVIIDYLMDGLSGIETLREIRKLNSSTPCVISSGISNISNDIPEELLEHTYFLEKPYNARDFKELVVSIQYK